MQHTQNLKQWGERQAVKNYFISLASIVASNLSQPLHHLRWNATDPRHVEVYVAAVSSTPKISVLKGPPLSPAPGFRSPLSHGEEPLSRRERQTRWASENGLFSGTKGKSCGGDSGSQLKDLPLLCAGLGGHFLEGLIEGISTALQWPRREGGSEESGPASTFAPCWCTCRVPLLLPLPFFIDAGIFSPSNMGERPAALQESSTPSATCWYR